MAGPLRDTSHLQSSESQTKECEELEDELRALKVAFEQYFLGLERHPPIVRHDAFKARLMRLRSGILKQTAVKFRVASLQTTAVTYDRLWTRTLQEMENGTYRRDIFKARLHAKHRGGQAPAQPPTQGAATTVAPPQGAASAPGQTTAPAQAAASPSPGKPVAPAAAGSAPKPFAPGRAVAAATGSDAGLPDAKLRSVYEAYVTAKKRCNEDVSKLSFETVAASLRKQVPALLKQHKAKEVEFQVVIKEGKAILKALPK